MFSCIIGCLLENNRNMLTAFLFHLGYVGTACFARRCKESSSPTSPAAAAQSSHCSSTTTHRLFSRGCNGPCARSLCSTYKPLLRQMLSCPVRCLAALCCTPVAGGGRTWKHSKHCCVLRPRHPHFHPPALFLKPTMGLASLPLSFGELRCRIFSRVRSCAGFMHSFKASARAALSLWQIVLVHLTPTSGSSRPADNI